MTSVFQLYGRPLAEDTPYPPLRIEGSLGSYTIGDAYEGRLQIIDNIGKCRVEIVESSLPPGAYAFVDNFSNEIVLRWDSFTPPEAPRAGVHNGDFELGDDGSWYKGLGWTIVEDEDAEQGAWCAKFLDHKGVSSLESARVPYAGQTINASCRFQQGASSSGNLSGRILLLWCDENGNTIPGGEGTGWTLGNNINSGSNGEYKTSSVTGSSTVAKTVAVGFSANRERQNRAARVDSFTWDHTYETGNNGDIDYTVTFKLTDSANRIAYWSGSIGVFDIRLNSQLYPFMFDDPEDSPIATGGSFSSASFYEIQSDDADSPLASGGLTLSLLLEYTTTYGQYDHLQDDADSPLARGGTVTTLGIVDSTVYSTYAHAQDDADSPLAGGGLVLALANTTTAAYSTYAHAQDDADSPLAGGGLVLALTLT